MNITATDILEVTITLLFAIGLIVIAIFILRSVKNDNEKLYFINPVDAYIYEYNKNYINGHKVVWAIIFILAGAMILFYHGFLLYTYLILTL